MAVVKLFMVWAWRCPDCGHRNTHAGIVEDDPAIIAEAREALGGDGVEDGVLMSCPETVFCIKCEGRFEADPQ